jgi:hypothetical protein
VPSFDSRKPGKARAAATQHQRTGVRAIAVATLTDRSKELDARPAKFVGTVRGSDQQPRGLVSGRGLTDIGHRAGCRAAASLSSSAGCNVRLHLK